MKKRVLLCLVVIIIAVTAFTMLVGCAPRRPEAFMADFAKSDSRYMTKIIEKDCDGVKSEYKFEVGINGNVAVIINEKTEGTCKHVDKQFVELQNDKVIDYYWHSQNGDIEAEKYVYTLDEAKKYWGLNSINSVADLVLDYFEDIDFKKLDINYNFTKNANKFVGNKDTDYEGVTIELANNEMIISSELKNEKNIIRYGIDYDKIIIPDEALNAKVQ